MRMTEEAGGRSARRAVSKGVPRIVTAALGVALLGAWAGGAAGARTRLFRAESYDTFLKFDVTDVTVGSDGRIALAPSTVLLADPGVRTVWGLAEDGKGRIILATGDEGQLVAQSARGEANKPEVLANLFDSELFAVAAGPKGELYAAGAPNGTVMKFEGGKARTLFDVPEGVVFALLAAPDGVVYAATGERGRLYRISPNGDAKVVNESLDQNLRSLAWGPGGKIWAGTDGRGLLLEINPADGKSRVLYDSAEQEVVSILPLPGGGAVFGANPAQGGAGGGGGSSSSDPPPSGGETAAPSGRTSGGGPPEQGGGGTEAPHPSVYKINPDGSVRLFWKCPQRLLHALALEADGSVLAATSDAAAIYRISPDGEETVLWEPEEEQVLSLLVEGNTIYAGTGNPGHLYKLGPDLAEAGTMTSDVLDAKDQSKWGVIRWEGVSSKGQVSFETRSGYTNPVDESWTDWTPAGEGPEGVTVQSPPGRFLQWRAHLKRADGKSPVLQRIRVSYGGANIAPRIVSLRVSPDEPLFTTGDSQRSGGITQVLPGGVQIDYSLPPASPVVSAEDVPLWVRRIRTVVWEAQDPDGDDLAYTLEIRAVGEQDFRLLAKETRDRGFSMESTTVPDGVYEIRLTVTDAPSNPAGQELTDSRITPAFHVDTVAPAVQDVKARRIDPRLIEVSGVAVDESSPLRRIEASVDGGDFRWLSPTDGLMDSPREAFSGRVPLDRDQNGNWITVMAQDEAGNRGSYRVWLQP